MLSVTIPRGAARRCWRWLLALSLLATVLSVGLWLQPTPEQLRSFLGSMGGLAPVLFVAVGVVLITILVPKTIVSVSAGALFGTLGGSLLMVLVATSAAALNYALARWWVGDRLARWVSDRPQWDAMRRVARDGGFRLQLLLRLAPIPTMLISYACGAAGARVVPFLAAAAVAVASQVLWVHSGTIAGRAMAVPSGEAGGEGASGGVAELGGATAEWLSLAITVVASVALTIYLKRLAKRELANA